MHHVWMCTCRACVIVLFFVIHTNPVYSAISASGDLTPGYVGPVDPWNINDELVIGDTGDGSLTIDGGSDVSSDGGVLGKDPGAMGRVTVDGSGSSWTQSEILSVGGGGSGELEVQAGGFLSSGFSKIGDLSGSLGVARVSGAGSTWDIGDALYIGHLGSGVLHIESGGFVDVEDNTWVARVEGAGGSLVFDGGTLNTSGLVAAPDELIGSGVITTKTIVSDLDLRFDSTHDLQQQIVFDQLPGQDITVNLDITDINNTGTLGVGKKGVGLLTIKDGRSIHSISGMLGVEAGSHGSATIDGAGSSWTSIASLAVGSSGSGSLLISNGANVYSRSGGIANNEGASGAATIDGPGSLWAMASPIGFDALSVGGRGVGSLHITNGGEVSSGPGGVGGAAGSTSTATVDGPGSLWTSHGGLNVGNAGGGELIVSNGGQIVILNNRHSGNSPDSSIGRQVGATGRVVVTGVGSSWTGKTLWVGHEGNGLLEVLDGAVITTTGGGIGDSSGSTGIATVSEPGSTWEHLASLYVGNHGNGTLNILGGGHVIAGRDVNIGEYNSGDNVLTVDGTGSTLDVDDEIRIGDQGKGTLNIINSGIVTSGSARLGGSGLARGHAAIDGSGSEWSIDGPLEMWPGATLEVHRGGSLHSQSAEIIGDSVLTVGGAGSSWAISGNVELGGGTINISDNSRVDIHGVLELDQHQRPSHGGTLNIAGGVLNMHESSIFSRLGLGTISLTGGRLEGVRTIELGKPFVQSGGAFVPENATVYDGYDLDGGEIEIEFGEVAFAHRRISVVGDINIASLGTSIMVTGYGPMRMGTYTVFSTISGGLTGEFEHIKGLSIYPGLIEVWYSSNAVRVRFNRDFVPGDLNADSFVGIDDLNIILTHWNQNVSHVDLLSGDYTGDGFVGIDDLAAVLSNWNTGIPPGGSAGLAIPEPSTMVLMGVASAVISRRFRARN